MIVIGAERLKLKRKKEGRYKFTKEKYLDLPDICNFYTFLNISFPRRRHICLAFSCMFDVYYEKDVEGGMSGRTCQRYNQETAKNSDFYYISE